MTAQAEIKKLKELSTRVVSSEFFVQHAATKDGLSQIEDGKQHGMFPIRGEAYDIEFAAACMNYVMKWIVEP